MNESVFYHFLMPLSQYLVFNISEICSLGPLSCSASAQPADFLWELRSGDYGWFCHQKEHARLTWSVCCLKHRFLVSEPLNKLHWDRNAFQITVWHVENTKSLLWRFSDVAVELWDFSSLTHFQLCTVSKGKSWSSSTVLCYHCFSLSIIDMPWILT